MELSNSDKKLAREIIEKGLQLEYASELKRYNTLLKEWESNQKKNSETYLKLYRKMLKFDKHIIQRYKVILDPQLILVIAAQHCDGILTKDDLAPLSNEAKEEIEKIVNL